MKKLKWDDRLTVAGNARTRLPKLAKQYFREGSRALEKETTWDEMHEFRLLTKRFRYTLEIFEPVYASEFKERLKQLRHVQQLLGDINDCITTSGMLGSVPGSEAVKQRLSRRADRKNRDLRRYWTDTFAADEKREGWMADLRRTDVAR